MLPDGCLGHTQARGAKSRWCLWGVPKAAVCSSRKNPGSGPGLIFNPSCSDFQLCDSDSLTCFRLSFPFGHIPVIQLCRTVGETGVG